MNFLQDSFVPIYAERGLANPGIGEDSMLIGGSVVYLTPTEVWPSCNTCAHPLVPLIQLNVSSPATPREFRGLIRSVALTGGPLMTMVQLFVCPVLDCYDTSTTYSTDTRSWLVRSADVCISNVGEDSVMVQRSEERAKIEDESLFLRARLVRTWEMGKKETLDEEILWQWGDYSDEFYTAHEPGRGLKLLGHAVRGTPAPRFKGRELCC